ncbi:hypothetical protein B9Z55_024806 [Caenorhabditis nigoni]|uniref:Uncharacterized protein n=1 Tax=Caenorhabditis nigoni TaxID=1611254 RepID=A0A2G5SW24_9PELO|nr:hypothetical protein B9Z55_024806 [Caenorhabditis nigoni]
MGRAKSGVIERKRITEVKYMRASVCKPSWGLPFPTHRLRASFPTEGLEIMTIDAVWMGKTTQPRQRCAAADLGSGTETHKTADQQEVL